MRIKTNLRFFKDFTRIASGLLASRWSQRSTGKVEMKTHYQQVPLEIVKKILEGESSGPEMKPARARSGKKKALKKGLWEFSTMRAGGKIS
jgi:hypothetical protein